MHVQHWWGRCFVTSNVAEGNPRTFTGEKKEKTAYEIRTSDYTNHDLHFIENIITSTLPLQLIDNNII